MRDVSFTVRRGEIVGVAGPLGAGRAELLEMLFGARKIRSGTVVLRGEPVELTDIGVAMRAGIAYVPAERSESLFPTLSVSANLAAATSPTGGNRFRVDRHGEEANAATTIASLGIRSSSPSQIVVSLSGGDQKKVVLARWLALRPTVLLLDQPTGGMDVGARLRVQQMVSDLVADGAAAVVASDDFDELVTLADRVLVMAAGGIVCDIPAMDTDATRLAALALGASTETG